MYVESSQTEVQIKVRQTWRQEGVMFHKLLNLETGRFKILKTGTLVEPANVVCCVEDDNEHSC